MSFSLNDLWSSSYTSEKVDAIIQLSHQIYNNLVNKGAVDLKYFFVLFQHNMSAVCSYR